jgi:hypothetical protein
LSKPDRSNQAGAGSEISGFVDHFPMLSIECFPRFAGAESMAYTVANTLHDTFSRIVKWLD